MFFAKNIPKIKPNSREGIIVPILGRLVLKFGACRSRRGFRSRQGCRSRPSSTPAPSSTTTIVEEDKGAEVEPRLLWHLPPYTFLEEL